MRRRPEGSGPRGAGPVSNSPNTLVLNQWLTRIRRFRNRAARVAARAAVNNSDLRLWSHNPRANGLARVWANEHLECAIVERRMLRHDLPNWAYPVGIHRPA